MIGSADIRRGKILIVDDEKSNVVLLERVLAGAGYACVSSTMDSSQVCDLYRDNRYDLILLDIQMPGMDGFQVMEGLAALETEGYMPVLAITAEPAHKIRALREGAKDFIGKPFDLAEVRMRVHNMLEVRLLHAEARKHARMLEFIALNDPLTGLANRRLLDDRMARALVHARRNQCAMAVIYLDLDGFKEVNDSLGHATGDKLLNLVAARLVAAVREEDTVARLGGDEFVIVLWHLSAADEAVAVAQKVVAAVSETYDIDGQAVSMTTSAGVAIYPEHGDSADALLKSADLALYQVKHAGKNAYRVSVRASAKLT